MDFKRLWHWQRFEPNLGDNLEVAEELRLYLEVAVGLTKVELGAFSRALIESRETPEHAALGVLLAEIQPTLDGLAPKAQGEAIKRLEDAAAVRDAAYAAKLAEAWGPFVRLGKGAHAINGQALAGLGDYLAFVGSQPGRFNLLELEAEVKRLNSVAGTRALFSEPAAGGTTSTQRQNAARSGSQTAGR